MGDKKSMISAILGPVGEPDDQDDSNEGHEISKELIGAVKSGDHEGVWNCLQAAYQEMGSEPDEDESEE